MFSTLQLGPLIQSCIESKKKCWYFNISILGGENDNWNNDLCQVDFTVCFYKGDAVTFVNFGYFFNARFETRLNRLFGEKEGGRVGGEEGEISEAVGGSQQGEVQQHLHRMGGSTIYGGNSTSLQGGGRERERGERIHVMAYLDLLSKSILRNSSHQWEVKLTHMRMNLWFFWR